MHPSKVSRSELIAALGGILLFIGVFLPWYVPNKANRNAVVANSRDAVSAWDAHSILRYLFLLAAIAPLVLLYIVLRDHELSWPRGEMTAVAAIAALGLIVYLTLIDKPGDTSGLTHLRIGVLVCLLGAGLMLAGSATRASSVERPRKPPGTI